MINLKASKKSLRIIILCIISVILIIGIISIILICAKREPLVISGVKSHLTVYEDDTAEDIQSVLLDGVSAVRGKKTYDVKVEILSQADGREVENLTVGEYALRYTCERKKVTPVMSALTVRLRDVTPPTITGAADIEVFENETISYRSNVTVTDDFDDDVRLLVDSSKVNLAEAGSYPVVYSATDSSGNTTEVTVTVTVKIKDVTAPTITGAADIEVFVNETVSYGEGVTVTDDIDDDVQLQVDSSKVNLAEAGSYPVVYLATDSSGNTAEVTVTVTVKEYPRKEESPIDITPPTIMGVADMEVPVNGTVHYGEGVTVKDDFDKYVWLNVDSSKVNLAKAGSYPLVYSATDSSGNTAWVTVTVTVKDDSGGSGNSQSEKSEREKELEVLCEGILKEILRDGMTDREKAEAIYNRLRRIRYVSTTDKGWVENAYIGLSRGSGDCRNYSAASKALLTAAGLECYELQRLGGTSSHFWQIVYIDGGWYHFDPCPTPGGFPIRCFLLTDEEVIAFSNRCTAIPRYFIYDHDACPYQVVQSRN